MAKWLHMPVVAEGVSTIEQLTFLRSIGCDHAQGFLFAKPMSVAEYTQRYLSAQSTPPTAPPVLQREPVDLSCLWDVSVQADAMFNGMVGGMGIYELCGDALEIRRVNDGYYELFGCTPKQVFDGEREALFTVHPDDREGLFNVCRRAGQSGRVERFVCRHIHSRNLRQMWLEARIRFMGKAGANDVFCFTFSDVTEQKEFEQSRALRNYAMLLRTVYSSVYELNMTQRRCRMVCSPEGEPAAEPTEQPWALLQAELARILPTRDEEIHDRIFTQGYLNDKLKESQSDCYQLERKIKGAGGQSRWASFTFIRVPTDSVDEVYLLCIADVDSRKRTEELRVENRLLQLKQQEQQRYQVLMEHLGTSLLEWDIRLCKLIHSPGYTQYAISGYDFRLLQSYKDLEGYIHPQDVNVYRRFVDDLLAHGSSAVTLRLFQQDGLAVWCRILCSLINDDDGHIVRFVAAINQIDEQVKIRESFLDEQTRFQTFADNFLVGLGIFEIRGDQQRTLFLSGGYRQMVGYAEGEAFYDAERSFIDVYPEDIPRFREATRNLLKTGKPFTIEYRVSHRDGHTLWMRSLNSVYPGPSLDVKRIFAVIQDITELKTLNLLIDNLPVGIGAYDIVGEPQPRFESRSMTKILASAAEGTPVPATLVDTGILQSIIAKARLGHMQTDGLFTLQQNVGDPLKVRVLSAAIALEGKLDCYCALIPESSTSV